MAEVNEVVGRALRLLRVIDPTESPEAEQTQGAIVALNAMLRRWEANGMALGWSDVAEPSDVLPLPEEAIEAVVYNLATRLRPEYGVTLEADVYMLADESRRILMRDVKVASPLVWSRQGGSYYDIRADQYE